MKEISSFSQFFSDIDCSFQCYNMGRRICPVSHQTFAHFENTQKAWDAPFLQHAYFALIFWKKNQSLKAKPVSLIAQSTQQDHHVWFLKLPLDEQAKLNLAARDDFLRCLFETLENHLSDTSTRLESLEGIMKDSPYGFQPTSEQMANFHAIVHKQLSLPASSYYEDVRHYLSQVSLLQSPEILQKNSEWKELGFQGFADVSARLDETGKTATSNEQLVKDATISLPIEPFQALASCLENQPVSKQITRLIYNRLLVELNNNGSTHIRIQWCIASIRATSQTKDPAPQIQLLNKILNSDIKADIEMLATISRYCWPLISHQNLLTNFLEALAIADSQYPGAFKAILSDLMFIPGKRDTILQKFRSPERSQQLSQAIGAFFKTL